MPGIVVGIDGSANARYALEWAVKEAAIKHQPLTVLTVNEVAASFWSHHPVPVPADEVLLETARKEATDLTEKAVAELGESRPASVTVKAVNGFPVEELISASQDADMIVLGSRGVGGFSRLMMGSVTSQVAQHAHCPVLIVPHQDRG